MGNFRPLHRLDEFPPYKGGHTCLHGGYVWEFAPGHPLQNQWGWVAQHRLVAETMLGRPLRQSKDKHIAEAVHHLDGDRVNNSPRNLQVLTRTEHHRKHARERADAQLARLTAEIVARALVGRTIREAAIFLGTTHMTIRRRFPDVIAHRKRRSPCDPSDRKWKTLLRPFAADMFCTQAQAAHKLGVSPVTIRKMCDIHDLVWVANKSIGRTGRPKGSKDRSPRLSKKDIRRALPIAPVRQRSARWKSGRSTQRRVQRPSE